MILTADKGVALVVLNTEDYIKKAEDLLNQNTYRVSTADPTMRLKTKMINLLKTIKSKGGISEELYKKLYPHRGWVTQILWASKVTQAWDATKAHSVQHWGCHLSNLKRSGKDPQAPGGKV